MIGNYKIIGICACEMQSEYPRDMVLSMCSHLEKDDYRILIYNAFDSLYYGDSDSKGSASIFTLACTVLPDVMIIMSESLKSKTAVRAIIDRMKENNIPVISVDCNINGCINASFSYVNSFERIVRHVIEDHGCKVVNFMAGIKGNEFSEDRVNCFKRVLAENGLECDPRRIDYGDFWLFPTLDAMNRFMATGLPMPEAIICANDAMAIAVCRFLKDKGYRIPDDVLVTGFDGIDIEKFNTPRLTTAALDTELLGEKIRETIDDLFDGKDVSPEITIPYKVKISQSCGCVPVDLYEASDKVMSTHDMLKSTIFHEEHMFHYIAKATKCSTSDELADALAEYADTVCWCCLNNNFLSSDDKYLSEDCFTNKMDLLLYKSGDVQIRKKSFRLSELLYDMENALNDARTIMFCPINFHATVYGYIAVKIEDGLVFDNTRRFVFNTNLILENYRQQRLLRIANAELDLMQMTDSMTGLYNRRGFYKNALLMFEKLNVNDVVIVYSVDMDSLKYINDTFGHKEGDRAIKAVSEALKIAAGEDAVTARFGGDEFAVLIPSSAPENDAAKFRNELEAVLDDFNRVSGAPYIVHASLGSDIMKDCTYKNIEEHLKVADKLMYADKQAYKKANGLKER